MKDKKLKIAFIIVSLLFAIPSILYWMQNKTVMGFSTYFNFFINTNSNKIVSTIIYLILFVAMMIIYLYMIKKKNVFKDIKQILTYVAIISILFMMILPWTTSDVFYYMGVGELDAVYGQNPYYVTIEEYYQANSDNIHDTILEQSATNVWADTTVVYGPVAQLLFKICSFVSLKNVDICLFVFKLLNVIVHIANCYLIYKISGKKKFAIIYGLNPFILFEFIANVHNDIMLVFFVILSIYFITKKKNIYLSILFLACATGIKYFTILLLPVVILYYFKEEKRLGIRFLRCIQYGVIFLVILALEYALYIQDLQVFMGLFTQMSRYAKSIHSVILQVNQELVPWVRGAIMIIFLLYYIKFCIDLLTAKEIKLGKSIRKYNLALILAILILTNCQQWYLGWLFATIMWKSSDMIKNIIGISAITEIANSVYMFLQEWYIYDCYYVGTIIILSVIWILLTNKHLLKRRKFQWIN